MELLLTLWYMAIYWALTIIPMYLLGWIILKNVK